MSHHVYTTHAFVIEGVPSGEANKTYLLFTRELGMIRGTAQGVRLLKSKLRFSLQDFSETWVSVVRGKEIWRVTNAKSISNLFEKYKTRKDIIAVVAHIFSLLKRLVPGEEKNEKLFGALEDAFIFLNTHEISEEEVTSLECIVVLKLMFELGYLATIPELEQFIHTPITREGLDDMAPLRKLAYREINKSLRETHL